MSARVSGLLYVMHKRRFYVVVEEFSLYIGFMGCFCHKSQRLNVPT